MAKVYINSNSNPEALLKENNISRLQSDGIWYQLFCLVQLYKWLVVRNFCEAYLAYIVYAKDFCDDELIAITNDNLTFKQQAHDLIKRRQPELWAQVLVSNNLQNVYRT